MIDLEKFSNITKTLSLIFNKNDLFWAIKAISTSLKVEQYCLLLWDDDQKVLKNKVICCPNHNDEKEINISLKRGDGHSCYVFQSGEKMLCQNGSRRVDFKSNNECNCTQNKPLLSLPLFCNRVLGVWNIHKAKENNFTKEDIGMFSLVADHIAIAISRLDKLKLKKNLPIKDDVTHLFNKNDFIECLEKEISRCKRHARIFSLVMADIDNSNNYNGITGSGESSLKRIAKIINNHSRKEDSTTYLGGNKFVLLLPEVNKSSAFEVAEKLHNIISKTPFIGRENLGEGKLLITTGSATYPVDGNNAENLIKSASKKMYF